MSGCSFLYVHFVCFCLVGHGVLWRRLSNRLGEEHKGQLSERRLDCLHLQRNTESETYEIKMDNSCFFFVFLNIAAFIINDLSMHVIF